MCNKKLELICLKIKKALKRTNKYFRLNKSMENLKSLIPNSNNL